MAGLFWALLGVLVVAALGALTIYALVWIVLAGRVLLRHLRRDALQDELDTFLVKLLGPRDAVPPWHRRTPSRRARHLTPREARTTRLHLPRAHT